MQNKNITVLTSTIIISSLLLFSGCASNPQSKSETGAAPQESNSSSVLAKEQILLQSDTKGRTPVIFTNGIDQVRQAGLRSLTFVGCDIKKKDPFFLSGRRPNKFGLFVGSGGETVNILLYPESDNETHVWVATHKSFVGLAGQQGWDKQVTDEMTQLLNTPEAK